ncbi:sigma factor [Sorangium cellulosum]|uniref:sigma factor n=1 Tax=Sorangium cellulosum TaxID=56 RepID=UPI001F1F3994|nr:sigma factor [Sorangium cellulosum]
MSRYEVLPATAATVRGAWPNPARTRSDMKTVRPRPEEGQEIDPPSRRHLRPAVCGRLARPPRPHRQPPHPAVHLDAAALLAHRPLIRATLRARGVLPANLDDLTQETVLGAWRSIRAGRFRPSPEQAPGDALRALARRRRLTTGVTLPRQGASAV